MRARNAVLLASVSVSVAFAAQPLWLFGKAAVDLQFWSAVGVIGFMGAFLLAGAANFVWEEWR